MSVRPERTTETRPSLTKNAPPGCLCEGRGCNCCAPPDPVIRSDPRIKPGSKFDPSGSGSGPDLARIWPTLVAFLGALAVLTIVYSLA